MRASTILLILGGVAILAMSGWLAWTAPMPGPLAAAHAGQPSLAAPDGCEACHRGDGFRSGCLECHAEIAHQLTIRRGFHLDLTNAGADGCASCHGEHYGEAYDLVPPHAWPSGSAQTFAHDHVAFGLAEAHDRLDCLDCHTAKWADERWPTARAQSFLGLEQSCGSCHADPHAGELGEDCARCHSQTEFRPAPGFDHVDSFPLLDAHADLTCESCHALDREAGRLTFGQVAGTDCASCHASPHDAPNELSYGADCVACHNATLFDDLRYLTADHAARFPLRGRHGEVDCSSCHRSISAPLSEATIDDCAGCHENPHRTPTATVFLADATTCRDCHSEASWSPNDVAARQLHAMTDLPLIGAHEKTDCRLCHGDGRPLQVTSPVDCEPCHASPHHADWSAPCATCHPLNDSGWELAATRLTVGDHQRTGFELASPHAGLECDACHPKSALSFTDRFPGRPPESCRSCHADPHAGQFEDPRWSQCTSCHASDHFQPSSITLADHQSYPLHGEHMAVPCISCHPIDETLGARRFVGTSPRCASCHANPHGEQFAAELEAGGCESCHTAFDGFDDPPFDHRATGWPLTGLHEKVDCVSCHAPDRQGVRAFRGVPRDCSGCHDDPHRGQLTHSDRDCTDCHSNERPWLSTSFDHQRQASFALDGKHIQLACRSCHPSEKPEHGKAFVRYRPIGKRCQDCHDFDR